MAVARIPASGAFARYSGLSFDQKPVDGVPGAEFYELDTGAAFRWDGAVWNRIQSFPPDTNTILVLGALENIRQELALLRLGMMDAGTCNEINPNDAQPTDAKI